MGQYKKDATPLLIHRSYIFFALTHQYTRVSHNVCTIVKLITADTCIHKQYHIFYGDTFPYKTSQTADFQFPQSSYKLHRAPILQDKQWYHSIKKL